MEPPPPPPLLLPLCLRGCFSTVGLGTVGVVVSAAVAASDMIAVVGGGAAGPETVCLRGSEADLLL